MRQPASLFASASDWFELSGHTGRGFDTRRDDAIRIEAILANSGDLDLAETDGPTGYWGTGLDTALRRYQKRNGLAVDGWLAKKAGSRECICSTSRARAARSKPSFHLNGRFATPDIPPGSFPSSSHRHGSSPTMRLVAFLSALMFLLALRVPAGALPRDADCPLEHPQDASLRFFSMTLDQNRPGTAWPPDSDRDVALDQGLIQTTTFYAAYQILRDQMMICEYSEIRKESPVSIYRLTTLPIFLPGILMRCEGILREVPKPEPNTWVRRWCTHDPDE